MAASAALMGAMRGASTGAPAISRVLRHNETRCTRAHGNGRKRTEVVAAETAKKRAEGSERTSVNGSLDHVIGVRVPKNNLSALIDSVLRAARPS
jgi:hypothetical protein